MKLKNIIEDSAEILGLQDNNFSLLKRCANLVLANIAANYRDCIAVQSFDVTDGKIEYKQFEKDFLRVKSVCTGGAEANYSLFIDFIKVPNGRVEVTYAYVPKFSGDDDEEITIPNLSEKCFVYGVITEYALISGMFNEAKIWNEKFEAGLFCTNPKYKEIILPAAKW